MRLYFISLLCLVLCAAVVTGEGCNCKVENGRDGTDGIDGKNVEGPPGIDGRDGKDGEDCIECGKGRKGDRGDAGIPGIPGANGKAGAPGGKGAQGDRGSKGDRGDAGSKGPKGGKGSNGDDGTFDEKTLEALRKELEDLSKEMDSVKTEAMTTKKVADQISSQVRSLGNKVSVLKKEILQVGQDQKVKQSLLPGGYSKFAAHDLQWKSLHTTAAALCRAVAYLNETERVDRVFPKVSKQTCDQVCAATPYRKCEGDLAFSASPKKASSSKDEVGYWAPRSCEKTTEYGFEPSSRPDEVLKFRTTFSFCCCSK